MKAIVQERYGGPEVLRLDDFETPVPVDDQVLVRVSAASLNAVTGISCAVILMSRG